MDKALDPGPDELRGIYLFSVLVEELPNQMNAA